MKKLALLCVLLALVAAGCGKKSGKETSRSKVTKSKSINKKNKNLALKDSEEFFDKDSVSEFAFVDDESKKNKDVTATDKKDVVLAENDDEDATLDRQEEDGEEVAFKTVHFDLNGDGIRSDQKDIVAEDCEKVKVIVSSGKKVAVAGHCCKLGAPSYNLALGLRRAESMKKELVTSGVAEEDIKTVSYGSEIPLAWSDKKDRASLINELAPNRRAEIAVQ